MRLALLAFCFAAAMPVTANDAHTTVAPGTKSLSALQANAPAKSSRLASPEDYDLDQLLRCAVGCQG
jgi:hypothetical protein